ncbi:MAG: DNA repair protein RadC [Bifidobacteriaceae bacterium]|jgi:DNA repair protein RadC|nr:DNA repair protein RadC [Bifidobacteriaceae bacterium]
MFTKQLPREKLKAKGVESLSDLELLHALIGSGNKQASAEDIAKKVLKLLKTDGANISYGKLYAINGMGNAKTAELVASFELAKRYLIKSEQPVIKSTEDALKLLDDIRNKQQEYFVCLTLDGANRLINKRTITIGTLTASLVHPREVFAPAIEDRAASIIVAHNHPSGSLQASEADKQVTKQLTEAGELLGIKLLDHIIVTKTGYKAGDFDGI